MSLRVPLSKEQAAAAVYGALRIDSRTAPSDAKFEILRSAVWGCTGPTQRVHILKVLALVTRTSHALSSDSVTSPDARRGEWRGALSALRDAGDLVESAGGHWSPSVTRLVDLPGGGTLLVGGLPTSCLPLAGNELAMHGPFRHLGNPPKLLREMLPAESLASWAKLPAAALDHWAHELIEAIDLQPYTPSSAEVFEFYRPAERTLGTPQFKRWVPTAGSTTGKLLARRRRFFGYHDYRVVAVRSGAIVASNELPRDSVRRLMYALDHSARNPVRVFFEERDGRTVWRFLSELPRPEQRTFSAFGTLRIPEDRPYERWWTLEREKETALELLKALKVSIVPGATGSVR